MNIDGWNDIISVSNVREEMQMGIRIVKPCNLSMLNFIEKFGPVEIDDLYSKFGNGIKSIVDEEVKILLDNAKIIKEDNGTYRAV